MKTKKISKKLGLNKETVARLDNIRLNVVIGGLVSGTCGDCETDAVYCTDYTGCESNFFQQTCQHTECFYTCDPTCDTCPTPTIITDCGTCPAG
jgi:hypothetical protein